MKTLVVLLPGLAALLGVAISSSNNGRLPGSTYARNTPSCGSCHASTPGGNSVHTNCVPSARSLAPGQSITINSFTTGGANNASNWGGITTYATAGVFSAGTNTRVGGTGADLTHSTQINNRNWTYGYTAPATPGLVQMYVVALTANGDGSDDSGDLWAFHGDDGASTVSTPLRLYVNAAGVVPLGQACVGGWGQTPVLGAKQAPTVGNANFGIEVHGAAPNAATVMLLGANPAWVPVELSFIGVNGCRLLVEPLLTFPGMTGAGNAQRAEGVLLQPIPIPSGAHLAGTRIQVQVAIVDTASGRSTPLTLTNAADITIR